MLSKVKHLSFNARLVLGMNGAVAVMMIAFALGFSFKKVSDLKAVYDAKIEAKLNAKVVAIAALATDDAQLKAKAPEVFAELKDYGKLVVKKSGTEVFSIGKSPTSDVQKLKAQASTGITANLHYNYDPLWPEIKSEIKLINAMLFLGMIFFSVSLYVISKMLIKPLSDVVDILSESTNLTTEHATKLKEMSASVQTSGDIINSGSESTTSSMQELTTMIESSVQELNKCMELADSVNSKADQGTDVMNRLVGSMEVIEEANMRLNELGTIFEEISSKTSVINDIVFKTQLLSFNASIEAARAGQHGRGFSVVAEEIGNLAQMSGKSATEISNLLSSSEGHVKNIISGTDEKIAEGRAVSLEALQSFDDIRRDIGEITESIQGVTTSSQGQEGAIKSTLNTMINMKETVMEQGIYTRSIGKSAHAISDQSDKLERAEFHAKRLIYGTAANHDSDDEMNNDSKKMVMHLVNKMGKSKMEVADEDVA